MPTKKLKGPLEKEIQSAILHYLWSIGYPAFHVPNHGKFDPRTNRYNRVDEDHVAGVPDIVCPCLDGKVCFFEVKSATGVLSPEQREYWQRMSRLEQRYVVVRSVADVRSALSSWGLSRERPNG